VTHAPLEQLMPDGHARPQPPQLSGSVSVLIQNGPQTVSPAGQASTHAPSMHAIPGLHKRPQAPQLELSVSVLTHCVPQYVRPDGQEHVPWMQTCPGGQAWPHVPQ